MTNELHHTMLHAGKELDKIAKEFPGSVLAACLLLAARVMREEILQGSVRSA